MNISLDEQYKRLEQTRMLLNPRIVPIKKESIRKYFREFNNIDLANLEKKMKRNIILYRAPLIQIHGSNMVNWTTNIGDEIYIDLEFLTKRENDDIIKQQLTHEIMHSLCRKDDKKMLFGHIIDNNNSYLKGINEAVTQVFTDDIEGKVLEEKDDYLYFVKNIVRILKNSLDVSLLANQYLNNNIAFEDKFNEISDDNFNGFARVINEIYLLSKKKYYFSIDESAENDLIANQKLILEFINVFIEKVSNNDLNVLEKIKKDFNNKDFLKNINILN